MEISKKERENERVGSAYFVAAVVIVCEKSIDDSGINVFTYS